MSIQNLLNQFMGSSGALPSADRTGQDMGNTLSKLTSNIPGGLAGGAAAGGIMALLVGSKSARKFAGKAATYGGAAMLGGLAYKAFQNWQQNSAGRTANGDDSVAIRIPDPETFAANGALEATFELTVIKAMVAAAQADGHIDAMERQRIFKAVEQMDLSSETKGMVFDLLGQDITIDELARGARNLEQKSELYLASCLAINPDHPSEQSYLDRLGSALDLPQSLMHELRWQAQRVIAETV
ncbi:tellurite resistance TerB family protein [Pseudomonadota bacterium]